MRKTHLINRLDDFASKRNSLLNQLTALTPDQISMRPGQHQWSILEVIEHLILAEKIVFGGFPDPTALKPARKSIKEVLLFQLVMFILKSKRLRVDVPDAAMRPSGKRTLVELKSEWEINHQWLRTFVHSQSYDNLKASVFHHPVSGPITPTQAFNMLHVHFDKHTRQIQGIRASLEI